MTVRRALAHTQCHEFLTTRCKGLYVPPITPITPTDSSIPPSPGGEGKSKKKVNPLTDLIETEKVYVDLLTGIMRVRIVRPCLERFIDLVCVLEESRVSMVATEPTPTGAG